MLAHRVGLDVADFDATHLAFLHTQHFLHYRVPDEFNLGVGEGLFLHDA